MSKWWKIDSNNRPLYINDNDFCIYAREYISGKGYQVCQTNSLIYNFKKSPSRANKTKEWKHRNNAIKVFKQEINPLLVKLQHQIKTITVTAVPSSKAKSDPEYNYRFEELFKFLESGLNLTIEWPVKIKKSVEASHLSEKRPTPESIKQNYVWKGFKQSPPKILYVFDDILTEGAHFRAMSDFLEENNFKGKVVGIFWVKTVWSSDNDKEWNKIIDETKV